MKYTVNTPFENLKISFNGICADKYIPLFASVDLPRVTDDAMPMRLSQTAVTRMTSVIYVGVRRSVLAVSEADYWWTPARHQETVTLLWEVAGALRKAASPWWRHAATVAWHVAKELLLLGILVGILLSSRGAFETRVVALLILIYSSIRLEVGGLTFALSNQVLMGVELRNLARSMKLKTLVDGLQADERLGMGILLSHISALSGYLGCLIAIAALVYSLF